MISKPHPRGRALALLGFDASEPLLPQLRLRLDQPGQLRKLVRESAEHCRRPFYYAKEDLWMDDYDVLDQIIWANAPNWIGPDDIAALQRWFDRGEGYRDDDMKTNIWWSAVIHTGGPDWSKEGLSKAKIETMNAFIVDVWTAWRDEEFTELSDNLRDAELTEAELNLTDRFGINFYDDVLDPLHTLWSLRKGNILHEMLDKHEPRLPLDEMHRIADAYLESKRGRGWKKHGREEKVLEISKDIRCIRVAVDA